MNTTPHHPHEDPTDGSPGTPEGSADDAITDTRVAPGTEPDTAEGPSARVDEKVEPGSPWAQLAFGVAALLVGALLIQQSTTIAGDLAPQGPRFLPTVVGLGWTALSLAYVVGIARSIVTQRPSDSSERFDHMPQVLVLVALLVAYAYALDPVGYLLATAVFFILAAAILGSRNHVRDAVVAVGLTVAVYLLFSRTLGIYLPPGVIPL